MNELWKNLRVMWEGLDQKRRLGLMVAGAATLVVMVVLAGWLVRTDYGVLFADLDERDAAAIIEELKHRKVPFRLEDNGTRILVPERQVHESRLALMSKGTLLNGAVGFEIFDNKDLGMTEYTQKVNYQRALQGELARTVMSMQEVKFARVHLVMPEASLFKRDKSKAKGSVSVVLKPGGRLSADQIAGIQRLVAAAAPGMEPGMVTVFDQRGVALSVLEDADSPAAAGSTRLRLKREVEDYLTRKIAAVMDRTFGPGQGIVSVDVTINFDEIKRTQQDVIPIRTDAGEEGGIVVRKRQAMQRQGGGPITNAADGNATAYNTGLNSSTEVEYEVGRRVEEVVTAPGGIRRLSVGVLVPKAMTEEQLARLRTLISMTAGLSEARGDAIAVHSIDQLMQNDTSATDAARIAAPADGESSATSAPWKRWGTPAASAVGALLMILAGLWLGSRWRAQRARVLQQKMAQEQRESLFLEMKRWIEAEKNRPVEDAKG